MTSEVPRAAAERGMLALHPSEALLLSKAGEDDGFADAAFGKGLVSNTHKELTL